MYVSFDAVFPCLVLIHQTSILSFYMKDQTIMPTNPRIKLEKPFKKIQPKTKMPTFKFKFIFISIFLSLLFLRTCNSVSILDLDSALASSEIDARARRVCTKKLEDCLEEEEMESETNRRVLVMQRKYISYETLRRDMVPCATPGASYYDCNGGHQANHYNRGCEVITRCARGIKGIKT